MTYALKIDRDAKKEMRELPDSVRRRVSTRLRDLQENPRRPGTKRLADAPVYSSRLGDYRILFRIDDQKQLVVIESVLHRKDAYR